MKGNILSVSETEILIRSASGEKVIAPVTEVKSSDVKPRVGDEVDFELTSDGVAKEVYILRAASQIENITQTATDVASNAFNKLKSQLNEENKDKLVSLTNSAAQTAAKLGGDLKTKMGGLVSAAQSSDMSLSSASELQNKFALLSLLSLLVLSFFGIVNFMGTSLTFYNLTESYTLLFFIVGTMVVAFLGLNIIIYRAMTAITLLIVILPTIDAFKFINQGSQVMSEFGMRKSDPIQLFFNVTSINMYLFAIAFIAVALTLTPGMYKAKSIAQQSTAKESGE